MSKRNRNKFKVRDSVTRSSDSSSLSSANQATGSHAIGQVTEYKIITADLIRLVVLNSIVLALVLVLYYTNRSAGYLEQIFTKLFNS